MKSCEKGGSPAFAGEWQKKDSPCGGSLPSEKEPGIGLLEGAGRDLASVQEVADCLLSLENVAILCHQYPDGDTLGSGCALCWALRRMGKRAKVFCSDIPGERYSFLWKGIEAAEASDSLVQWDRKGEEKEIPLFSAQSAVAVDVADESLLGEPLLSRFGGHIDLCIDHHGSNRRYAAKNWVDDSAAATTEMIWSLLACLGLSEPPSVADCIFTGLSTDTGCFRYSNVTARTFRIAADMLEKGARGAEINRRMFETKSRSLMDLESLAVSGVEYYYRGRCALLTVTREMIRETGASEDDLEGLPAIPRQIEGVLVGLTIREKESGGWKVSVRTEEPFNAADICRLMDGGGHAAAGGCTLSGSLREAKSRLLAEVGRYLLSLGRL
jgi:phosphoesterase RecJ-like protein